METYLTLFILNNSERIQNLNIFSTILKKKFWFHSTLFYFMKGFSEARVRFYAEPLGKQTATACVCTTSGKPSTRLPLGGLVE